MNNWKNIWLYGKGGWIDKWMNKWKDDCVSEWMNKWLNNTDEYMVNAQ